jgi:predicted  nucleic acid-binding Zn-ribbon protein
MELEPVVQWISSQLKKPEAMAVGISVALIVVAVVWAVALLIRARRRLSGEFLGLDRVSKLKPATAEEAYELLKPLPDNVASVACRMAATEGRAEANIAQLRGDGHWPRQIAGLLVFVGLAGTVFAMSAALANLGSMLSISGALDGATASGDDIANTVRNTLPVINNLLSGLFLAAVATIAGLLGTVFLAILNGRFTQGCATLAARVEVHARRHYVPLHEKSREALNTSGIKDPLVDAVAAATAVADQLKSVIAEAKSAVAQMSAEATAASHETQNAAATIATGVRAVLADRKTADERFQTLIGAVQQPLDRFDRITTQLTSISHDLESAAHRLNVDRDGLDEASKTVSGAASRMEREVRDLRESLAAHLTTQMKQFTDLAESIRAVPECMAETLRLFDRTLVDIVGITDPRHLREAVDDARTELREAADTVSQAVMTVDHAATQIHNSVVVEPKRFYEALDAVRAELQEAAGKCDRAAEKATTAAAQVARVMVAPPRPAEEGERGDGGGHAPRSPRPETDTSLRGPFGKLRDILFGSRNR